MVTMGVSVNQEDMIKIQALMAALIAAKVQVEWG